MNKMDEMFSLFLLFCVMNSVTSLPVAPSLQLFMNEMNGLDSNTLILPNEIENPHPDPKTLTMIKPKAKFHPDQKKTNMTEKMSKSHPAPKSLKEEKETPASLPVHTDAGAQESIFKKIIDTNKAHNISVHEGDILQKPGRSAISCTNCLWPKSADGTVPVPYNISNVYTAGQVSLIYNAMAEFETLTCVRFVPRTTEKDYIFINSSKGCTSFIGRIGGAQLVGVASNGCMTRGTIEHELNHALGFYHEHMRSDRDNYVNINFQYISPGDAVNFQKANTNNLGLEYDYGSIMHYDKYAFSNTSNKPSIVPKPDPTVPIGQTNGLSTLDISKINRLYQCSVCANLLNNNNGTMTSANYPSSYPNGANCVWLIRTPSGQATLSFTAFDVQSTPDCASDYIKIYDGPSKTSPVLLDKTCGSGLLPLLIASTNQMLVEFVSDSSVTGVGFKATYGSVKCGGNFFGVEKNFTSPGYPGGYSPNLDCTFNITAPAGYKISLTVNDFELEDSQFCISDYIMVQDHSLVYGPFCANTDVPLITSSGNSLTVIFHSDRKTQLKGFHATYSFI